MILLQSSQRICHHGRLVQDHGRLVQQGRGELSSAAIRQHDCFLLDSCTMPVRPKRMKLDKSAGPFRRALRYAFYDWAREMPRSKRILMYVAIVLQGYPFYFALMWAFKLPTWLSPYFLILPRRPVAIVLVILFYFVGRWLQNGLLSSEFVRKTQLEADQIAARDIQQTLQPGKLEELPGYELESFYKPLR